MTVMSTYDSRPGSHSQTLCALEDRFEVIKEIGDGSFGSVHLARVRTAGANVARRNTMVSTYARQADGMLIAL
jgi:meiosis induction protein kinase IME2/SME1